jgi:membrane-associated protease RseP (regulator of RpoE activity)
LHLGLLATTFASVTLLNAVAQSWGDALTFACALLAILLSHELGHYIAGRIYGVSISLPYFIPFPLGIGTLGAVIRIRTQIPTRTALVDIGAAGPIAGMVVAIPLLIWGTAHSHYTDVTYVPGVHFPGRFSALGLMQEWSQAWHATHGADFVEHWKQALNLFGSAVMPEKATGWSGDNLLSIGIARLLHGAPGPNQDLAMNPVANAAWFGMFVTLLNLLPVGQLDGGHVTHALFGKWAVPIGRVVTWGLLVLAAIGSFTWLVWFGLLRGLIGLNHPPVIYPAVPLARSRYVVAAVSLLLLVLVFLPVPFEIRPAP